LMHWSGLACIYIDIHWWSVRGDDFVMSWGSGAGPVWSR
jgi:hypothetical protein